MSKCQTRLGGSAAALLIMAAAVCAAQQQQSNPFYNDLKQPWQLYHEGKLDDAAAGFRAVLEKASAAQDHMAQAWAQDALGTIFNVCAYALAARLKEPLLFKGRDFPKTDLTSAV